MARLSAKAYKPLEHEMSDYTDLDFTKIQTIEEVRTVLELLVIANYPQTKTIRVHNELLKRLPLLKNIEKDN
jgi:hypothetical protein